MVDAYSVERGLNCGCICPSCFTPMIARQGTVREWHFAHATRRSRAESICEYSALVSIRLMAHQVVADADRFYVPPGPLEQDISRREICLESIEIDAQFEGLAVDAVATVKNSPLVIYMSYDPRLIPEPLFAPDDKKAGVLEIQLGRMWSQIRGATSRRFDKAEFERTLVEDIVSKVWAFHPIQVDMVQTPQPLWVPLANVQRRQPNWVSTAEVRLPSVTAVDNSPLLIRYRCRYCSGTWFAGSSESDATRCAVCKQPSGVVVK